MGVLKRIALVPAITLAFLTGLILFVVGVYIVEPLHWLATGNYNMVEGLPGLTIQLVSDFLKWASA